jgi:multiple sugar transport system ATP-binding protein
MIVIRLGGREVIARVDPDEARPQGSRMQFEVDMRKACLFDPGTEQRIGACPWPVLRPTPACATGWC